MNHQSPELPERYTVREVLADEATIVRLRAFDATLHREVLLEYPGRALWSTLVAGQRDRILREARVRASVDHPGIQRLREVFEVDGVPILVLDPTAGESLDSILEKRGHLDPDAVIDLGVQVAEAVQAIHAKGAVHRDVTAENILCDGSTVVVRGLVFAKPIEGVGRTSLDYGSEAEGGPEPSLPRHPAPEQIAGQPADARADVFGLGCVLYEALTGQPAFLDRFAEWREPVDPKDMVPDAPARLCEVLRRCLRPSPTQRFATMMEVGAALQALRPRVPAVVPARSGSRLVPVVNVIGVLAMVALFARWLFPGSPGVDRPSGYRPEVIEPDGSYANRYTRGRALLIASDYKTRSAALQLDHPEEDIEKLAALLKRLGWDPVVVVKGPAATAANIRLELAKLDAAGRDEQVLVYFAGHGTRVQQVRGPSRIPSGFAVPDDVALKETADGPRPRRDTCVRFSEFEDFAFCESRAKHVMLVFDCCHSGAILRRSRSISASELASDESKNGPDSAMLTTPHAVVITSCGTDQQTPDRSVFASEFLAVLKRAEAGETVTPVMIGAALRPKLESTTRGLQFGLKTVDGTGTFVFTQLNQGK